MATVEFFGDTFGINPDVSEFALLEFAEAASDGQDGDTMEGLASLMRLVKECIAPADVVENGEVVTYGLKHFLTVARKNRAGAEQLTTVIGAVFGAQTERPTGRPADSSAGPVSIAPKSAPNVDDKASLLPGRPDLQLAVSRAS